MTWTERLKQFTGLGGEPEHHEIADILPMMTLALARLGRVAALAPTPTIQEEFAPVLTHAEAVVQRVRDVARDFGPVSAAGRLSSLPDGHNHWARLRQALDQHREVRQRMREVAIALEDTNPPVSQALSEIGREEDRVIDRLRDLIALADPQALN